MLAMAGVDVSQRASTAQDDDQAVDQRLRWPHRSDGLGGADGLIEARRAWPRATASSMFWSGADHGGLAAPPSW